MTEIICEAQLLVSLLSVTDEGVSAQRRISAVPTLNAVGLEFATARSEPFGGSVLSSMSVLSPMSAHTPLLVSYGSGAGVGAVPER